MRHRVPIVVACCWVGTASGAVPTVGDWIRPEPEAVAMLEATMVELLGAGLTPSDFETGSAVFDGEWYFGMHLTIGLGSAQLALADDSSPVLRDERAARVALCVDRMLEPGARAFTVAEWGSDPIETLGDPTQHHAAYLGYLNVLLGMERLLHAGGASPHAELHDRVTAALIARLDSTTHGVLATYPGEAYPVDLTTVVAGIALHQRATGADHTATLELWAAHCRSGMVDARSGLLLQAVDPATGAARDLPRGSGTLFGAYFLAFVDDVLPAARGGGLSAELWAASRRCLLRQERGLMGMREYLSGVNGREDIDSGEIVAGLGTSATGFAIGVARVHGDTGAQLGLLRLAYRLGVPRVRGGAFRFERGGPLSQLSNAILFAMLTAERRGSPD